MKVPEERTVSQEHRMHPLPGHKNPKRTAGSGWRRICKMGPEGWFGPVPTAVRKWRARIGQQATEATFLLMHIHTLHDCSMIPPLGSIGIEAKNTGCGCGFEPHLHHPLLGGPRQVALPPSASVFT